MLFMTQEVFAPYESLLVPNKEVRGPPRRTGANPFWPEDRQQEAFLSPWVAFLSLFKLLRGTVYTKYASAMAAINSLSSPLGHLVSIPR